MTNPSSSPLRRAARAATGGPRGYFNAHFSLLKQDVNSRFDTVERELSELRSTVALQESRAAVSLEKYEETVAVLGTQLARLADQLAGVERVHDTLRAVQREVEVLRGRPVPEAFGQLDGRQIELLNVSASHHGYAAAAGLWFNPALHVAYGADGPFLGGVNERVAEIPFVFRALGGLPPGARILDIGACESTVAFSLASLGYRVTALDPRPYPLAHPNLDVVTSPVETFAPDEPYDAAVLLSTVEHIGVGAYEIAGHEDADLQAMAAVRRLLRPGGRLVLTTPFGHAKVDDLERTYDREGIRRLLDGFVIEDVDILHRTSPTSWEREAGGLDVALDDDVRVVMVAARAATAAA